jgi:hypothetical protein
MNPTSQLQSNKRPSPLRVMRRWIFGERKLRAAPAIDLDVLERQVDREEKEITTACAASCEIATDLDGVNREVEAALNDAESPGVITREESCAITRHLLEAATKAHNHNESLRALT